MASEYAVERTTFVNAAPESVYARVSDFHHWVEWSPWEGLDPDLRRTYDGTGPGSTYAWTGNRKAGQGTMRMLSASEAHDVVIALTFEKPFKSTSTTTFTFTKQDAGTAVTWSMRGENTLMTKVMGIFTSMDKLIGPDFEKGLANLKKVSEDQ